MAARGEMTPRNFVGDRARGLSEDEEERSARTDRKTGAGGDCLTFSHLAVDTEAAGKVWVGKWFPKHLLRPEHLLKLINLVYLAD